MSTDFTEPGPPGVPSGARRRRRASARTVGRAAQRRPRRSRRRTAMRLFLVFVAVCSVAGMGAAATGFAAYNGYRGQLPDPQTLAGMEPALDSYVYARDGSLVAVLHGEDFRHEHVALAKISPFLQQATVDEEDKSFWSSTSSYDLPRLVKSAYEDIRHPGVLQGASTITEQLAKISFLPSDQTIDRKFKELILGQEIADNFSKSQILEMYLNRISYGNFAVGVETAAQLYFHKHASDLDLAESSMLAGLPNAPSLYNPLVHGSTVTVNPLAKQRQLDVLTHLQVNGHITARQVQDAYAQPLTYHPWYDSEPNVAPDFIQYLRTWLTDHYGQRWISPGGWNITTTLDPPRQALAEKTLHDGIASIYSRFNAHDGAVINVDPRDGEVIALVGTWDYTDTTVGQVNMAVQQLQPGSTIKLFTYTAAIASRLFTMNSVIQDAPFSPPLNDGSAKGYQPLNYDRRYHGNCALALCLGNSFNVPAVRVEQKVGIPLITNLEIAAGLTSLEDPANRPAANQWAATLGGLKHGITPLELVNAASTIADLGIHHDPTPVLRITERVAGSVVYTHDPKAEARRVVPENVAYIMNEITSNDSNRVAEFGPKGTLTLPGRRVSAKTGTTENFVDNWTVGWTPDTATVVWVGNPTPSCLKSSDAATIRARAGAGAVDNPWTPSELRAYGLAPLNGACGHLEGSTGITGAAPIWHAFMAGLFGKVAPTWYVRPASVIAAGGNGDDGTFLLPGQQPSTPTGCYYWGPSADPNNPCRYVGNSPPAPPPPGAAANPPQAAPPGQPAASPPLPVG